MMKLFDTHFHCDPNEKPEDFKAKCETAGVAMALACGGDFEDSERAARFVETVPGGFFACGVHPQEAAKFHGAAKDFKKLADSPKFAAVGEIGLDFHYAEDSKTRQLEVFKDFLWLALDLGKPAVVHCRDAESRFDSYSACFELLSEFARNGGRFELHCFTGTTEWAKRFVDAGACFGVGGMITFKKAQALRETVATLPVDRILLETDAPYLAPVPHRGKPNHPALLPFTAKALAELLGRSCEDVAKTTFENSKRFLGMENS